MNLLPRARQVKWRKCCTKTLGSHTNLSVMFHFAAKQSSSKCVHQSEPEHIILWWLIQHISHHNSLANRKYC